MIYCVHELYDDLRDEGSVFFVDVSMAMTGVQRNYATRVKEATKSKGRVGTITHDISIRCEDDDDELSRMLVNPPCRVEGYVKLWIESHDGN